MPGSAAFAGLPAEAAQLFFRRLVESLPDHVYFKDREGRFVCLNQTLAASFGLSSPDQAIGRTDYDFFPPEQAARKDAAEREIVRTGEGVVGLEEPADSPGAHHRWVLTTKLPLRGHDGAIIGTFGISRDITERRRAQEELQRQHRLLGALIEILPCSIFVKDRAGRISITNEAYRRGLGLGEASSVVGHRIDELLSSPRAMQASVDDRAVLEQGVTILNREQLDLGADGRRSWGLLSKVPLRGADGRVEGIVGMLADITVQKQAEERAIEAREALEEKNRQMETELVLARELQTELIAAGVRSVLESLAGGTRPPRIAFHYEPCEHLAGDFLQAVQIGPTRFALLLCDVMGHGVKAALVTTLIRGLLGDAGTRDRRAGKVLELLNERLCTLLGRPPMPRFVTALYAVFDLSTHRLQIANAGHPWPLCHHAGGHPVVLASSEGGPALGLIPGADYPELEFPLAEGDRLLFYTDGWTEETNADSVEFGRSRLKEAFGRLAETSTTYVLPELAARVQAFAGRESHSDDLCAVFVEI